MDTTIKKSVLHPNVAVPERIISFLGGSFLLYNALTHRNLSLAKTLAAGFLIFRGSTTRVIIALGACLCPYSTSSNTTIRIAFIRSIAL